jgi:arylsulfatase A-like enzyme
MGVAGHPTVKTPTLDRLAGEGLRCTKAVANCPLCTPSRAPMLSGRYPLGHGAVTNWLPLPTDVPTFGEVLQGAGYRTGYIGKWHLNGAQRPARVPVRPTFSDRCRTTRGAPRCRGRSGAACAPRGTPT